MMKLPDTFQRLIAQKGKSQPIVIFDIGSASIGGAVVSFKENTPYVAYSIRKQIPFNSAVDEEHFIPAMSEILSGVAKDIRQSGLSQKNGEFMVPHEIVCVLAAPWHTTQTLTASFEHKENFLVTDTVMDNLLAQIRERRRSNGLEEGGAAPIEEIVIDSTLNGYSTRSPLGKTARRISATFLESSMSKELNTKIRNAIFEVFSSDIPVTFRSFTLASFSVMRDMFTETEDFLLLDVTGEISGMSVVRSAVIGDTLSFPYGLGTLIRNISQRTGSIPEETRSRIKLSFTNDDIATQEEVRTEGERWATLFGKACEELFTPESPLPGTVFLVTNPEFGKWFKENIERVDFSQFTVTREPFYTQLVLEEHVDDMCVIEKGASCDTFLAVDALFCAREHAPE